MYYRRALKLQAFLDMASESGKLVQIPGGAFFSALKKMLLICALYFLQRYWKGIKQLQIQQRRRRKAKDLCPLSSRL